MFYDLIEFPISSKKLSWEAKEVIRDFEKSPMLFHRIMLMGTSFPHRALKPFVRIGKHVASRVEISQDGLKVNAYFDQPVVEDQKIEFGYDDKVFLVFPEKFQPKKTTKLDLRLIPANTKNVEKFRINER
jgi:hypothetical protein